VLGVLVPLLPERHSASEAIWPHRSTPNPVERNLPVADGTLIVFADDSEKWAEDSVG
jgi:hypothetical protein